MPLTVRSVGRYASYKTEFENFYRNGGIILADRYTTSNMVHQASWMLGAPYLRWLPPFLISVFIRSYFRLTGYKMHICQQRGITIHSTLQIIFFFSFNNLSARWIIFISADKIISQHSEDLDSDAFVGIKILRMLRYYFIGGYNIPIVKN